MSAVTRHARSARPLGASVLALMFAVPLAAGQAPQPAKASAGVAPITIEGCLTRQARAGEAAAAADQFVVALAPRTADAPATGSGGAVPAPAVPKMYALRTADDAPVTLASFVNQRVKVEGTTTAAATTAPLAGRSPEATPYQAPVATGSAGSGPTGTPFDRANLPTIVVKTVTSLAPSCR
jgi:hypothetical protein